MRIIIGSGDRRVAVNVAATRKVPAKGEKPAFTIVDPERRSAFDAIANALFGERGSRQRSNAFNRGRRLAVSPT